MILQTLDTVIAFALVMLLLSLMVTVLVQMVVSILGLRGRNLLFGLQQLVYAIAPDLSKEDIQSLAKMIQGHPFFQAGGRRSSIDIQPKEVLAALNQVRSNGSLATPIKTALDKLFTEGASSDSNLAETLNVLQSLRAGTAGEAESVSKLAGEVLSDTKEIVVRIDTWFDSAMNHAAEKFKLNTRWATAVLALLLAVSLQVDAPDILSQLWTNPSLTADLIVEADQIQDLFDKVYESQDGLMKLEDKAKDLDEQLTEKEESQAAQADTPSETNDSAETDEPQVAQTDDSTETEEPQATQTDDSTETEEPEAAQSDDSAENENKTRQEELDQLNQKIALAKQIRSKLFQTDLVLFYAFAESEEFNWENFKTHLPGILAAALLLSLGAPWWYGIIGQLVGYKSLLSAGKKEEGS